MSAWRLSCRTCCGDGLFPGIRIATSSRFPCYFGWLVSPYTVWRLGAAGFGTFCFTGFLLWGTVSAALAPHPEIAFLFTSGVGKVYLPFLVGITTINSLRELKILAWVIVLSVGIVGYELNFSYLKGFNLIMSGAIGLDNNSLAIYMAAAAGFGLMFALRCKKRLPFMIAVGSSSMTAHSVLISNSRGGMLGLLCAGIAAVYYSPKTARNITLFLLVGVLALRFVGPSVIERFSTAFVDKAERDESAQSRLDLWSGCITIMTEKPIFGMGPMHWRLHGADRFGFNWGKSAHSTWFETGADMGIPALLLLIGVAVSPFLAASPILRDVHGVIPDDYKMICAACLVGLVGFIVSSAFVTAWGNELFFYITLVGLAAARSDQPTALTHAANSGDSGPPPSIRAGELNDMTVSLTTSSGRTSPTRHTK